MTHSFHRNIKMNIYTRCKTDSRNGSVKMSNIISFIMETSIYNQQCYNDTLKNIEMTVFIRIEEQVREK